MIGHGGENQRLYGNKRDFNQKVLFEGMIDSQAVYTIKN